ncbi:MAG: hypothetical protein N3D11_13070 [Candidatus Sumerlaeia bacterium]|nr:hypothetical protein [Candidatus Sumerlaeia bacterium]
MTTHVEPIYWPESFDEHEREEALRTGKRIVQFRHRVGRFEVTRLILDGRKNTGTPAGK